MNAYVYTIAKPRPQIDAMTEFREVCDEFERFRDRYTSDEICAMSPSEFRRWSRVYAALWQARNKYWALVVRSAS